MASETGRPGVQAEEANLREEEAAEDYHLRFWPLGESHRGP